MCRKHEEGESCENIDTAGGVRVVQGEGVYVCVRACEFGWIGSKY